MIMSKNSWLIRWFLALGSGFWFPEIPTFCLPSLAGLAPIFCTIIYFDGHALSIMPFQKQGYR